MNFAFLIQEPGIGGLASMHDRLEEVLEENGHQVDKFIVQKEDVIEKIKKEDYDVAHLYFTPFLNPKFFLRLLKFNIISNTQVFVNYYNIKPENTFRKAAKRFLLPLTCDKVILPSDNMEKFYTDDIGINNTATLRPIVENKFYEVDRRGDKVIYFGHSREDKGIDRLLDFASEDYPVYCFFIQDRDHVLNQYPRIREKIEDKKIFLEDGMPVEALSEAKVSLFPFHHLESTVDLPLALIESLAAGVPVLTSDIEPLNSYLPEDFLVSDWQNENIEKRIEKLDSTEYREKAKETAQKMKVDGKSVLNHYLRIIRGQDLQ